MPASLVIIISTLVTLLTTAGGITGLTITGEPLVNGTLGGNVSIMWKVQNIVRTSFSVHINKFEPDSESENELFIINRFGVDKNVTFVASTPGRHDNLRKRSSTYYYYTGKSGGQGTGQVVLTITDLELEDSSTFLLLDGFSATINSVVTMLSVQYGPEKCGSGLEPEYIVNKEDQLNLTIGFCGKPQPIVRCKFDGQTYTNVGVTEGNQYNYTYTFVIPTNLKPCERKLIFSATGHGKPVTRESIVVGNSPDEKKVSGGVCAGHIIGFEIGVILICVLIYVYIVVWKATKETGKLVGFIIAVVVGLALIIGLSVSYADLRKNNGNDNCGTDSLDDCDKAFIVFGVIDIVVIIVVIISVKVLKGRGTKTLDQQIDSRDLLEKESQAKTKPQPDECDCRNKSMTDSGIVLIAYNDGEKGNVHMQILEKEIEEEMEIKNTILGGANIPATNVKEFKKICQEYYQRNSYLKQFPPGYNQQPTSRIGDMFKQLFEHSGHFNIISGPQFVKQLKLFRFTAKDLKTSQIEDTETTERDILVANVSLNFSQILIMSICMSESENVHKVKNDVNRCNGNVKALRILHEKSLTNTYAAVCGIVACPRITRQSFEKKKHLYNAEDVSLFLTADDLQDVDCLKAWWEEAIQDTVSERKHYQIEASEEFTQRRRSAYQSIVGETMATMSIIDVTLHASLLLNIEQQYAINKGSCIVNGPFGSGKSLVLKEIARRLSRSDENSSIYFVCLDPYSLSEVEAVKFLDSLEKRKDKSSKVKLYHMRHLVEKAKEAGIDPNNLPNIIDRICNIEQQPTSFLFDEMNSDTFTKDHANRLRNLLDHKDSNLREVVLVPQSIQKDRDVQHNGQRTSLTKNEFQQTGLENVELPKRMRMTAEINDVIQVAEKRLEWSGTTFKIPESSKKNVTDDEAMHLNVEEYLDTDDVLARLQSNLPEHSLFRSVLTNYRYQPGYIGHTAKGRKPKLIFLDYNFGMDLAKSGNVLSSVLKMVCLNNRHTTIVCGSKAEAILVCYALKQSKKNYRPYFNHLLEEPPMSYEEKEELWGELKRNVILVTDYRGFRGCETDHCITFVNQESVYKNHILVEVLARAVAHIDILVLPIQANSNADHSVNTNEVTLADVIDEWKRPKDDGECIVEVSDVSVKEIAGKLEVKVNEAVELVEVTSNDEGAFWDVKETHKSGNILSIEQCDQFLEKLIMSHITARHQNSKNTE